MAFQGYDNVPSGGGRRKKKVAVVGVSSVILVAMVVAVAVGVSRRGSSNSGSGGSGGASASMRAIQALCQPTDFRETCINSLKSANSADPKELVKTGFQAAIEQIKEAAKNSTVLRDAAKDPRTSQALENCHELMDYAIDDLQTSFSHLGAFDLTKVDEYVQNLKVWLSGAVTYQQTCFDGFENTTGDAGEKMRKMLKTAGELTSNGLAMVSDISSIFSSLEIPGFSRRLLSAEEEEEEATAAEGGGEGFPTWVGEEKRRLLEKGAAELKPNVVVAKDGSGSFKTVNEALNAIPKKNDKNATFVIYIKEGNYSEQVMINKSMTHVMMIGDGPTKTVITGNKNFADGTQTFKTSTVSIIGSNFIAKNMGFENSAGAEKHQAVALRVQSDMSIFYNCNMYGYQDTLYAHAHRQFYRDCTIFGTIDFIFGDAAAVFQNCRLVVRRPLDNQQCIVTAQGRTDRREPTGIVLQNCTVAADPLLDPKRTRSFLGRPWKEFSMTVVMQSQIDDHIHPDGWLPWMGNFGLDTCFYGEYGNRGPGSDTSRRVTWRGIQKITPKSVQDFTPGKFLGGDSWIPPAGVPYSSRMMAV